MLRVNLYSCVSTDVIQCLSPKKPKVRKNSLDTEDLNVSFETTKQK